jgi:molybdopterin/thiamine biosynthesis adenylyltransferase
MNIVDCCKKIVIVQVGCGGTGSWLVPLASKLLNNIKLRLPDTIEILYNIIDDDSVEERNIMRQNFSDWDIGKGKAMSLVSKYCYNFNNMVAVNQRLKSKSGLYPLVFGNEPITSEDRQKTLVIVIGCVDNNQSRQSLNRILKSFNKMFKCPIIYIDSGNLLYSGQIVTLSFGFEEFLIEMIKQFEPDKADDIRKHIKKRKKLHFNKMFPIGEKTEVQQSCAFFGDQSQAINSLAATLIFCNLQKILVTSELPPEVVTFNSSGYSTFEV